MSSIIFKVPATRWRLPFFPLLSNRPPTKPEPPSRLLSPPSAPPTALTGEFSTIPPRGLFSRRPPTGELPTRGKSPFKPPESPLLLPRVPPRTDPTGEFSTRPPTGVPPKTDASGRSSTIPPSGKFPSKLLFLNNPNKSRFSVEGVPRIR